MTGNRQRPATRVAHENGRIEGTKKRVRIRLVPPHPRLHQSRPLRQIFAGWFLSIVTSGTSVLVYISYFVPFIIPFRSKDEPLESEKKIKIDKGKEKKRKRKGRRGLEISDKPVQFPFSLQKSCLFLSNNIAVVVALAVRREGSVCVRVPPFRGHFFSFWSSFLFFSILLFLIFLSFLIIFFSPGDSSRKLSF